MEERQGDRFLILLQACPIHFPSKYKIRRAECIDSHVVCKLSRVILSVESVFFHLFVFTAYE